MVQRNGNDVRDRAVEVGTVVDDASPTGFRVLGQEALQACKVGVPELRRGLHLHGKEAPPVLDYEIDLDSACRAPVVHFRRGLRVSRQASISVWTRLSVHQFRSMLTGSVPLESTGFRLAS